MLIESIPPQWRSLIGDYLQTDSFASLEKKVEEAYRTATIYPAKENIFRALQLTIPEDVKVVIIGQDPYHEPGQAHGLAFSVLDKANIPGSLKHIFNEIEAELGISTLPSGNLERWAGQGVLLLNSTLTVEAGKAGSHENFGWQLLSAEIIHRLSENYSNIAFMLWGNSAKNLSKYINQKKHVIYSSSHPSGLSWGKTSKADKMKGHSIIVSDNGETTISDKPFMKNDFGRLKDDSFWGSNQFLAVNKWLVSKQKTPVNWA